MLLTKQKEIIDDILENYIQILKNYQKNELNIPYKLPLIENLPLLQFVHKDGVVENISNVKSLQDAQNIINSILKNSIKSNHTIENKINYIEIKYTAFSHYFKIINLKNGEF